MGQYYKIITRTADGITSVNDRTLKGDSGYCMAKLLEHGWCECGICRALAYSIVNRPTKVCWVGDYAEPEECEALGFTYDEVWGDNAKDTPFEPAPKPFQFKQFKYLVNHDKKQYVDIAKYMKASTDKDGWCIFPVAVLTALGNGRGGGDYHHEDDPLVGSWAFDTISITDQPVDGFEEIEPVFID